MNSKALPRSLTVSGQFQMAVQNTPVTSLLGDCAILATKSNSDMLEQSGMALVSKSQWMSLNGSHPSFTGFDNPSVYTIGYMLTIPKKHAEEHWIITTNDSIPSDIEQSEGNIVPAKGLCLTTIDNSGPLLLSEKCMFVKDVVELTSVSLLIGKVIENNAKTSLDLPKKMLSIFESTSEELLQRKVTKRGNYCFMIVLNL